MRTLVRRILLLSMVVLLVGGVGRSFAQDTLVADIPFAFTADGTMHHAGRYEFFLMKDGKAIEFESSGRRGEFVGVTRLTDPEGGTADGRLVFDKVSGTYWLSELWAPGRGGFLMHAARATQARRTVPLQWSKAR